MGYRMKDGRWADTIEALFLAADGVISASGSSAIIEGGDRGTLRLSAAFTAVAGTNPTLDIKVMTCETEDGTFREIVASDAAPDFDQFTGATTQRKCFPGCDRFIRLDYTLGGTSSPSFTGSITGELC